MSRRARERREAMDAKYLAMAPSEDSRPNDDDDSDFDSLAIYREAESTDIVETAECPH